MPGIWVPCYLLFMIVFSVIYIPLWIFSDMFCKLPMTLCCLCGSDRKVLKEGEEFVSQISVI